MKYRAVLTATVLTTVASLTAVGSSSAWPQLPDVTAGGHDSIVLAQMGGMGGGMGGGGWAAAVWVADGRHGRWRHGRRYGRRMGGMRGGGGMGGGGMGGDGRRRNGRRRRRRRNGRRRRWSRHGRWRWNGWQRFWRHPCECPRHHRSGLGQSALLRHDCRRRRARLAHCGDRGAGGSVARSLLDLDDAGTHPRLLGLLRAAAITAHRVRYSPASVREPTRTAARNPGRPCGVAARDVIHRPAQTVRRSISARAVARAPRSRPRPCRRDTSVR